MNDEQFRPGGPFGPPPHQPPHQPPHDPTYQFPQGPQPFPGQPSFQGQPPFQGRPPFQPQPWGPPPPAPPRWPVAAALLNLTGLALGYAYLGRWLRFALYLLGTVALVVVAFLTGAASLPWVWRAVALVWVVWMAVDGYRIARRHHPSPAGAGPRLVPAAIGVVAVAAIVAGYVLYGFAGGQAYATGTQARDRGDCAAAIPAYDQVTGLYELTLSGNVAMAETERRECEVFMAATDAETGGEYAEAVRLYQEFRTQEPDSPLAAVAGDNLRRTYGRWATSLREAGSYDEAIEVYRSQLQEGGEDVEAVRVELAATYVEKADDLRASLDGTAGDGVEPARGSVESLLVVAAEFGDTPSAAGVPQGLTATYDAATAPLAAGTPCEALPVLDYFTGLPNAEVADVRTRAEVDRAAALYGCGLDNYEAGTWSAAVGNLEEFLAAYPDDPQAAAARSLLIAAKAAEITGTGRPTLPGPFVGDNPGPIDVTFYNDSDEEVRVYVVGATAHEVVLPPCPGCTQVYTDPAAACPTLEGKPSYTVRLAPGEYTVVGDFLTGDPVIASDVYEPDFFYTQCLYKRREF